MPKFRKIISRKSTIFITFADYFCNQKKILDR